MPKISQEESLARRGQVIDACAALFRTRGYRDVTLAQIAEGVAFGRANIYNYFRNKDEVFLALLTREHGLWAADLSRIADEVSRAPASWDDSRLAVSLAKSLEARVAMLKLLAASLPDMEQNSRDELLVEMKTAYGEVLAALGSLLRAARPEWDEARADRFVFAFMPFLHGVYPYAFHSEKQLLAMAKAGVADHGLGVAELVEGCAKKLLQDD